MTHDAQKPPIRMGRFAPLWRRLASRFFANRFFRRRVATPWGAFDAYVTPGSHLAVLRPTGVRIEQVHLRFIDRWVEPNSVVWDVGANMGLFAFPAALKAKAGHVYCFEPDCELAAALLRSLRRPRNAVLKVTVAPLALSDRNGIASFLIAAYGRAMNKLEGLGPWHDHLYVASERRIVATARIDGVVSALAPPSVIKIDVEGAEMLVLDGGRATIAARRPVMLIEGPEGLAPALNAFLKELDYVMLDGAQDGFPRLASAGWDTVAVPREKWEAEQRTPGAP